MRSSRPIALAVGVLAIVFSVTRQESSGAPVTFTLDPARSALAFTPNTTIFGSPVSASPQGPGSFLASYSGTIDAELTESTIQLLGTSQIVAGISGNWRPGTDYSDGNYTHNDPTSPYVLATAPANYGVTTILPPGLGSGQPSNSATRNLAVAFVDAAPKPLVDGAFNPAGAATRILTGTVFYDQGGLPPITRLADHEDPTDAVSVSALQDVSSAGAIAVVGDELVLTLPVSFTISYNVAVLQLASSYTGTLIATAPLPTSGLAGDFNKDGVVDGADFLLWQRGETSNPLSASELATWKANYGAAVRADSTAVPEPSAYMLSAFAALSMIRRRK